jgi:DNA-binding CsgD family transcriptional regulator
MFTDRSEAPYVVSLHEAKTARELAARTFDFAGRSIPQFGFFLALRPVEFELPSFSSRAEYQSVCDEYIFNVHKYDIWLKRGPIHPGIKIVRHTDHTPSAILKESQFYRDIMLKIGCLYGLSLVAWSGNTWLAILTFLRTEEQGDFTDEEVALLGPVQLHFESAVRRVAQIQESTLGANSLTQFIAGLPTAALVLDWELQVLHYNPAAEDLCLLWRYGDKAKSVKRGAPLQVPGDIQAFIAEKKNSSFVERKFQGKLPPRPTALQLDHPTIAGLYVGISFVPARNLTLSKGTFLLALHHQPPKPDENQVYDLWARLSRREREIVKLALAGKNSVEISTSLGTAAKTVRLQFSSVYKKLGIKTRFELLALFANFTE